MSKNMIKKIHQFFNFVDDWDIKDNIEIYKDYVKYTNREMVFSECYEKIIFSNELLLFIKEISVKYPYLILSFTEIKSDTEILKYSFWNGYYFFCEIKNYKLFNSLKLSLGNYFSIFFDILTVDYFGEFIYFNALKEAGKILNCIENKFSKNLNFKEIFKNGNLLTRCLNFNISEVLHILTCKIEG